MLVDPDNILAVSENGEGRCFNVGILCEEEIQEGLLLFVAKLVIPDCDATLAGVEMDIWRKFRGILLGWSVKHGNTTENSVFGPVSNYVSNSIGVYIAC